MQLRRNVYVYCGMLLDKLILLVVVAVANLAWYLRGNGSDEQTIRGLGGR